MSWQATAHVKQLRTGLSKNEKFVLLVLADYHRVGELSAWPSEETLAEDCLMKTERGVQKILARLEKKGFIVKTSGCGRGNVSGYQIVGLDIDAKHDENVNSQTPNDHSERENGSAAKGEWRDPKGRTAVPHNRERVDTSKNEERVSICSATADDEGAHVPHLQSQHSIVRNHIEKLYSKASGQKCPWSGRTGKVLKDTLDRLGWSTNTFIQAVDNRFASELPLSEDPIYWLPKLAIFLNGPLDKFKVPMGSNGGRKDVKRGTQFPSGRDHRLFDHNIEAAMVARSGRITGDNSADA